MFSRDLIWLWDFYSIFIFKNGAELKLKLISVQLLVFLNCAVVYLELSFLKTVSKTFFQCLL